MRQYLLAVLVSCVCANPQNVKSRYSGVKGGYGGHGFQTGENLIKYNNTYGGYNTSNTYRAPVDFEKGVCYIEVPTASLVKDPAHIPAGNGSRSDLSRIRTCCKGYTRNIHNFKICDPVCTKECVNALCTGPEICTCFPDHVKNLGGFCVPTCPIGCQNGHCAGGECICKEGFRLDSESKFCIPFCWDNCGGVGNCTAPNTCECSSGYRYTPEGSCRPHCERCGQFAECVAPNDCRCRGGYIKNPQGDCLPYCANKCQPNEQCVAPNICSYITILTTANPKGLNPREGHNNPTNMETTRTPNYNPNQQRPANPSNQPGYPSNQQPGYPNNQQSPYPGTQQSIYPGYFQPYNPGHQQSQYPIAQPDIHYQPENQPPYSQGNLSPYYPGNRPSNYPDQIPTNSGRPPIYNNPGQQASNYPGNQYGYYDHQRPNYPDNQHNLPSNNGNEPYYPGSQYYPGNQQYPGNQHYYPGSQYYPQQQSNNPGSNKSNISSPYGSQQSSHNLLPESQLGNVEVVCSKPCINGVCVGQDTCACNEGYVFDNTDPTAIRCKPYCPGGCPNGVCSSPNFCICNLGYYKDHSVKGRTNCVKRIRRSADAPVDIAELLTFEIPDDEDYFN